MMEQWIFKLIYYPVFFIIAMCAVAVTIVLFKDVGWYAPFRWLCLIGLLAYIADLVVKP